MEGVRPISLSSNGGLSHTVNNISTARIFFGRGAVMAKALGTTPEEEHKMGLHKLAKVRTPLLLLLHAVLIE